MNHVAAKHAAASAPPTADEDAAQLLPGERGAAFVVDIDGWEGPLDLLLTLAREQKVDLRHISIVQLADQYLAFIDDLRARSLTLAAEYLVMAAWLADLKSRLLLPEPPKPDEPSSEAMAGALAFQLRRLDAMREMGALLLRRPQLDRDFWIAGRAEPRRERLVEVFHAELPELLRGYAAVLRRSERKRPMRLVPFDLDSVETALARIRASLGRAPDWETLACYLPPGCLEGLREGELRARAALAATFTAVLELTRQGVLELRQSRPFGPIYVKAVRAGREPVESAA